MQGLEYQPHINLRKDQVQPVVLTVGDPQRVDKILALCDSYEELAFNREYRSADAVVRGQHFTVISHGVGVSASLICFEELIKLGAKIIIRAGTCGSLKPEKIKTGDVYVPYAVGRDVDATDLYVPRGLPAVATPRIYDALLKAGKDLKVPLHSGVGLSSGLFYPLNDEFVQHLKKWGQLVDVVEFEFQALFIVGIARGIETGGIVTVDGSPLQWDQDNYDPKGKACDEGKTQMLRVAVETCARLRQEFAG
ncbi:hypothetical protein Efla_006103 [Eimeria flavescens]